MKKDNRILCTFSEESEVDDQLRIIQRYCPVAFGRIFVLYAEKEQTYILTYNADLGNLQNFPKSTILCHRHRDTNTLYTINALNYLVKSLNNGILDKTYPVKWQDYANSVLLLKNSSLSKIDTVLVRIVRW